MENVSHMFVLTVKDVWQTPPPPSPIWKWFVLLVLEEINICIRPKHSGQTVLLNSEALCGLEEMSHAGNVIPFLANSKAP